tara:strand:- start:4789 stop:5247 length:459 start_codon:yes stop_codon:yes gene_type:complete
MSFQKAHQISNELGEIIVQTGASQALNGGAANVPFLFQPLIKNYRVLELGVVSVNDTTCTSAEVKFGFTNGGNEFVTDSEAFAFTTGSVGEIHSTSNGLSFNSGVGATGLDADGVPVLKKGQVLYFRSEGTATAATRVIAFARLAPIIEYKD